MVKLLVAVAFVATVMAGCGDDAASPSTTTGSAQVEVTAVDFAFEGVPETLDAGEMTFALANEGAYPHEMAVARILDDTPLEEIASAGAANIDPSSRRIIEAVEPGGTGEITVELESGRYGYVCWLRDGTNAERHAERGMIGEFTVQ